MQIVSVVIPTYNEEENIPLIYERVKKIFEKQLVDYDYRILYIDNCSTDQSRIRIKELAEKNDKVQYIFNMKNFGFSRSTFYGLTQSVGDCTVLLFADMQDPPELIIDFVSEWEKGSKVVVGIKNKSQENSAMDDPLPYLRGIVAELAPDVKKVYYEQKRREHGKTSFNFIKLYDVAMLGLTSYSKALMRISMFVGIAIAVISFVVSLVTLILKLTGVIAYPIGSAATLFGVFFLGGVQLIFLGILGEYAQTNCN